MNTAKSSKTDKKTPAPVLMGANGTVPKAAPKSAKVIQHRKVAAFSDEEIPAIAKKIASAQSEWEKPLAEVVKRLAGVTIDSHLPGSDQHTFAFGMVLAKIYDAMSVKDRSMSDIFKKSLFTMVGKLNISLMRFEEGFLEVYSVEREEIERVAQTIVLGDEDRYKFLTLHLKGWFGKAMDYTDSVGDVHECEPGRMEHTYAVGLIAAKIFKKLKKWGYAWDKGDFFVLSLSAVKEATSTYLLPLAHVRAFTQAWLSLLPAETTASDSTSTINTTVPPAEEDENTDALKYSQPWELFSSRELGESRFISYGQFPRKNRHYRAATGINTISKLILANSENRDLDRQILNEDQVQYLMNAIIVLSDRIWDDLSDEAQSLEQEMEKMKRSAA